MLITMNILFLDAATAATVSEMSDDASLKLM